MTDSKKRLQSALEDAGVQHFGAGEFGQLTHAEWDGPGFKLPDPPKLQRIVPTAQLADAIREQWGSAIKIVSGYRPPEYNEMVGGAPKSQHKAFRALDIRPVDDGFKTVDFLDLVRSVVAGARVAGWNVGLGLYWASRGRFAHIDVGAETGFNRQWEKR